MARKVLVDLDFQGASRVTNLPSPATASEAATAGYVTNAVGSATFANLTDVDVAQKTDQAVVYYSAASAKFKADGTNTILSLTDGGNF
jgi:hypothetical protein